MVRNISDYVKKQVMVVVKNCIGAATMFDFDFSQRPVWSNVRKVRHIYVEQDLQKFFVFKSQVKYL